MKPSFLNFLLNKAKQVIAPDDDGQVQAEIDQIVPKRQGSSMPQPNPYDPSSALSAVPGYAGGNLGQQLNPMIAPRPERTDELAPFQGVRPRGSFAGDAPPVEGIRPGPAPQMLSTPNETPNGQPTVRSLGPQVPLPAIRPQLDPALAQARQGYDDARNQPLTFGVDNEGNTRYAPQKGAGGRIKAGLKVFAQGGGIPGFVQGAIRPELPAQMRHAAMVRETGQNLQTEMGIAREQSQTEENQAQAEHYRNQPGPEEAQKERRRDNLTAAWRTIVVSGQDFTEDNPEHKKLHDEAQALGQQLPYGTKYIRPGAEKVPVTTGGQTYQVSPGEALRDYRGQQKPPTGVETPAQKAARQRRLQEDTRKRSSYEGEAGEWSGKEATFRQNKAVEDAAILTKTAQLQALHVEEPSAYGGLMGGTRSQHDIDVDKARLLKEVETHRGRATHFQTEADKAAGEGTKARRNAGLYGDTGGPDGRSQATGVIGRAPARDGKHHYTTAEIRAQAEAAGVSYESLYNKLKFNKRVVID